MAEIIVNCDIKKGKIKRTFTVTLPNILADVSMREFGSERTPLFQIPMAYATMSSKL